MYIVRHLTGASFEEIEREFGGRHHSTALHSINRIEARRRTDEALNRTTARLVNAVVEHSQLETVGMQWAAEINAKSPQAQRMLKYAFNLLDDGLVGQQLFAGEATRLAYGTEEAREGRDAFVEKRKRNFKKFPWTY